MSKKKKFEIEFAFKASPAILYNFLTTASGLSEWFAESVDVKDDTYIFYWSGSEERAKSLEQVENECVKFRWEDADEEEYFEFRILKSEVTGDTILAITDFADDGDEADQRMLWENQVHELQKRIGG